MDVGTVGIAVAVVSGIACFALGRWVSRSWRAKTAARERAAAQAAQSRQVRRARERRERR